jgi:hypothetical protein
MFTEPLASFARVGNIWSILRRGILWALAQCAQASLDASEEKVEDS